MTDVSRRRVDVTGVVQGVGFRPFVHHLANELDLSGSVHNDTAGVLIEVEGLDEQLDRFQVRLVSDAPPLARIDSVVSIALDPVYDAAFRIEASEQTAAHAVTSIPPDASLCDDCLGELLCPTDRRYRYPFMTCTNCGPRFTIVTELPYDRPHTTMAGFDLCDPCAAEYRDPTSRRHHAQPLACPECGPHIVHQRDARTTTGTDAVLAAVHHDLANGLIVAMKGIGGYHLVADASNDEAIAELRRRKHRADKPFAVMVAELDSVDVIASVDAVEAAALRSAARPVVLLRARRSSIVSDLVAPGNPLIGVMLPYSPLHHLLLQPVPGTTSTPPPVLVMTSGNLAGEPICHDDDDAFTRLAPFADTFCYHDRPIQMPCDDSVVRILGGGELPIRRSRGYAPLPVRLPLEVPPLLAVGGEIKNTFCIANGHQAWLSQHLGDMQNLETIEAFEVAVKHFGELYEVEPRILGVDMHPDYLSRRWANELTDGLPIFEVQHHHAHLAALMAEHGLGEHESIIGIVFDGTGYGTDGTLWGGEVLVGGYARAERWGHLRPVALPGGGAAVHNPYRFALAQLRDAGVGWTEDLPSVQTCEPTELRVIDQQLERAVAAPLTSSMGRLFDAVASLLDLRHRITYEAQAAIDLEALAAEAAGAKVPLRFTAGEKATLRVAAGEKATLRFELLVDKTIDSRPLVHDLVAQLRGGVDRRELALAFHLAVVDLIVQVATRIRTETGISTVGLTGGVFQNALLTDAAITRLEAAGLRVVSHHLVPPNDGGLALGQAVVAGARYAQLTGAKPCA